MKQKTRAKAALQARDLEHINKAAEQLNHEAAEVLDYQAICERD
ncbi:MAG TPA: hypothetical protein VN879_19170 [Candidatus Acidoferrales bacterium]|jgi:hypothetical protein|nr:hypothetical protein [Candidatus Acidoferrales bacterium]